MNVAPSLASRFYAGLQPAIGPAAGTPEPPGAGAAVRDAAISFVDALRQGEETARLGLAGKADAQSVVTALASTELAVQTAVTVRDKVVEAYQEILRMPV